MSKKETAKTVQEASALGFRNYYGKLYAALLNKFGAAYIELIEDAIQNAFYKSLKTWKADRVPMNKENWLFIVAKNDLINQLKAKKKVTNLPETLPSDIVSYGGEETKEDPRLATLFLLTHLQQISKLSDAAIIVFTLKNIFGFHIKELAASTLMTTHALYKNIKRTEATLKQFSSKEVSSPLELSHTKESIALIEEILYAIFNLGFDQFDASSDTLVNQDICMEALSLAKILAKRYKEPTTSNLIALFCFHLARIPAKIEGTKMVAFFNQDQSKWSKPLMDVGFHYLQKPSVLNKYYLEALIVSKHMVNPQIDRQHWQEIARLYELLLQIQRNPIIQLNYSFSLFKAEEKEKAIAILNQVSGALPKNHLYLSLIKATILKEKNAEKSVALFRTALGEIQQKIRKDHIGSMIED